MISIVEIVNTNNLSTRVKVGEFGILIGGYYVDLINHYNHPLFHTCDRLLKRNTGQVMNKNNFKKNKG